MSSSAHYNLPPLPSATNPTARSNASQVSDVKLFNEQDGGNIEIIAGIVTMSAGLDTSVYLSLFGGNELDDGLQGTAKHTYWANLSETEPAKKYVSRTQNILRALPSIPANLMRVQDAVNADLSWMLTTGVASKIVAVCSMPGLNKVSIAIAVTIGDRVYEYEFVSPWSASK